MSERTRYEPYTGGVFTSKNKQVAGSEYAVDNTTQTVLYGPGENTRIYDKIKQHYPDVEPGTYNKVAKKMSPKTLYFVFYDDPITEPGITEGYTPSISGEIDHSNPNMYPVFSFIPDKAFNDGKKHTCLGVMYNGKRLKIKFQGLNPGTALPFFYVEEPVFQKTKGTWNAEQTKWYGTFVDMTPVNTSFGKRRKRMKANHLTQLKKEINYLIKLR
jgi:hypothetical protein